MKPYQYLKNFGALSSDSISIEKIKSDRRELDKVVMGEILGLTEEEQLEVYRAVVDLVKTRLERAKSLNKVKKAKEGIDIDSLAQDILKQMGRTIWLLFIKVILP